MKIGVDNNISIENALKKSDLGTEVNASDFNALLSNLLLQLESGEISLDQIVSEEGLLSAEGLDFIQEFSSNVLINDTGQLLVNIEKLKTLVSDEIEINYVNDVEVTETELQDIVLSLNDEEVLSEALPTINNVFELQINQFQGVIQDTETIKVDDNVKSDVVESILPTISNPLQTSDLSFSNVTEFASVTQTLGSSPVAVNQFNIVNAIKSQLSTSTDNGLHKLTVRLHPEKLGRINIDLNMKDGIVSGVIRLSDEQAKVVFTDNIEAIKVELQNQGIKVESLDINLANSNSNSSMFKEDSFNQFKENQNQRFATRVKNEKSSNIEAIERKKINNIYREEGRINILI